MTVHFIGVGPGAEDLLTIRGKKLINKSPICMYAGSLISKKILNFCPKDAVIKNTAYMNLEQILSEFKKAEKKKLDISRLHSGDLSIWSAMGEQIRILEREKRIDLYKETIKFINTRVELDFASFKEDIWSH